MNAAASTPIVVEVWGDLACFARPELKIERSSYPVMNPSAARGLLESIFCKPIEFRWRIDRIDVLNPIGYVALRRNEMKNRVSMPTVKKMMKADTTIEPIYADDTKENAGSDQLGRTQRQTMALKDVRYRIHAHIECAPGMESRLPALMEQATRRIGGGKCFQQPYFGEREFVAFFEMYDPAVHTKAPIPESADLGLMVYDTFDLGRWSKDDRNIWEETTGASISIFRARLQNGTLIVPPYECEQVFKPDGKESHLV